MSNLLDKVIAWVTTFPARKSNPTSSSWTDTTSQSSGKPFQANKASICISEQKQSRIKHNCCQLDKLECTLYPVEAVIRDAGPYEPAAHAVG